MPTPESVQVAFRVYATDWGMRGSGSRQIDWLVDGRLLHRDNVIFVIDGPRISPLYYQRLHGKYGVYNACGWWKSETTRWRAFLREFIPKHWVSYNDYHPRHKIRNRLLRDAGCQTWHYSHSVNLPKEGYQPWKELEYDHLVLWNDTDARQFDCTIPHQKHILGPLFSSQVPRAVVAVFDSTWEHYPQGARSLFFAGLYRYLEKHPGMVMLYKPKHTPPVRMPVVKNFYILPAWIEPGLVIGCADLTIGLAFTSPVVEALAAGRPAVYYDPLRHPDVPMECLMRHQDDPAQRFRELLLT